MTSPAQLTDNIANAQLSTGPRTSEGKARSAANGTRHGVTAREFVIREDERAEFAEFLRDRHGKGTKTNPTGLGRCGHEPVDPGYR